MPWSLRRELHIDINAGYGRVLMTSATDSALLQPAPDYIAGDGMPIRVYFWERGTNGTLLPADPGPDTYLIFTGRAHGLPTGSPLLFETNDFAEIAEGVWQGTLDLTPAEFAAHLAASPAGAKIIIGEVEVRDSILNIKRCSFQFDLTARPGVYNDEDAPSSLPTPDAWLEARRPAPLALAEVPVDGGEMLSIAMTIDGDPVTVELTRGADLNGKAFWQAAGDATQQCLWNGDEWIVVYETGPTGYFTCPTDSAYPPLAGPWTAVDDASGEPVLDFGGTAATALDQAAIVTHSDATLTEWACVRLSPVAWLPRTAGIIRNRTTPQWERTFVQDGTIQTEILPDQ